MAVGGSSPARTSWLAERSRRFDRYHRILSASAGDVATLDTHSTSGSTRTPGSRTYCGGSGGASTLNGDARRVAERFNTSPRNIHGVPKDRSRSEPTDLPEGTEVELTAVFDDDLGPEERQALEASLERSAAQLARDELMDADEVLRRLRRG